MSRVIDCSTLALQRKSSTENTKLKRLGAVASAGGYLWIAQGSTNTDTWVRSDGGATYTPVIMPETTALSVRWAALGTPRTLVGSAYESPIDTYLFRLADASILTGIVYQHILGGPYQNAAVLSLAPATSGTNYDGTEVGTPTWAAVSSAGGGYTFAAAKTVTLAYNMSTGGAAAEGASATAYGDFGFITGTGASNNGFDHRSANGKHKHRLRNSSGGQISLGGTTTLSYPLTATNAPHFQSGHVSGATQYGYDEGLLSMSGATGGTGAPDLTQYGDSTATNRQLFLAGLYNFVPTAAQHLVHRNAAYELARNLGVTI